MPGIHWRKHEQEVGGCLLRYTVKYIPLNRIKPVDSVNKTQRTRELRKAAQDFLHLLIVQKGRKKGEYLLVNGRHSFDFFKNHTTKKTVPCLVDEGKVSSGISSLLFWFRKQSMLSDIPCRKGERPGGRSVSIIRSFLKKEPRFKRLSWSQQIKVLRLGFQYKQTTVSCMKAKVDAYLTMRANPRKNVY